MQEYIARMRALGFKSHEAVRIYESFMRFFDLKHLNDFLEDLEREEYVADV